MNSQSNTYNCKVYKARPAIARAEGGSTLAHNIPYPTITSVAFLCQDRLITAGRQLDQLGICFGL
jgi:hypothetical protein